MSLLSAVGPGTDDGPEGRAFRAVDHERVKGFEPSTFTWQPAASFARDARSMVRRRGGAATSASSASAGG